MRVRSACADRPGDRGMPTPGRGASEQECGCPSGRAGGAWPHDAPRYEPGDRRAPAGRPSATRTQLRHRHPDRLDDAVRACHLFDHLAARDDGTSDNTTSLPFNRYERQKATPVVLRRMYSERSNASPTCVVHTNPSCSSASRRRRRLPRALEPGPRRRRRPRAWRPCSPACRAGGRGVASTSSTTRLDHPDTRNKLSGSRR